MANLLVPVPHASIAEALLTASPGDTIILAADYGPETVLVGIDNITITGPSTAHDIYVFVADNVVDFFLLGDAPLNVTDLRDSAAITGNEGDNNITVTGGIDTVDGGGGDDRLVVDYSASDIIVTATTTVIDGGLDGVTVVAGTIEKYTILTGSGADTLTFTTADGDNYIDVGEGANTIVVGNGANTIIGGAGIDTITFGNGDNAIDAGAGTIGANTFTGGSGNNTVLGSDGIDTIALGGGNNYVAAGDGANTITIGPTFSGDNVIIAGSGIDTIAVGSGDNCIDAGVGTVGANTITVGSGNNKILGSEGIDTITVGDGNNYIAAAGGANTITAGSGNNFITADEGIDTITAMGGNNVIEAGTVGANTVTTGVGNDVVETGNAADTVDTGGGDDILKDTGGAGTLTAGEGHDRLIMDYSGTIAPVSSTANEGAVGTYSGVINATNYSGVEEFHITGGSANDTISTGVGADVLDGGVGADSLSAGKGSDVIYGGVGDVVDGGEDTVPGNDFDVLVLKDFGDYNIVYNTHPITGAEDSENGIVQQLGVGGDVIGAVTFSNIEKIEFEDTTITTPEDTPLVGNLFAPVATTTVTSFVVGTETFAAGATSSRTEGDLTINLDGTYTFTPAPNYNGPGPVINYTTLDTGAFPSVVETSSLIIEVAAVDEMTPHCLTAEAPTVTIMEDVNDDGQIASNEIDGLVDVQIALPGGAFAGDTLAITDPSGNVTNVILTSDDIVAGEVVREYVASAAGETMTVTAAIINSVGTSGMGSDSAMVVCFVQGTLIATGNGDISVEDLKVGDLVQTRDRGLQPLRWSGRRYVSASELAENENLRPIRISKKAMGAGDGVGDLVVSQQHRILVASKVAERMFGATEVLIAAKQLLEIDGVEIAVDFEDVVYFHILFDHHEIVFADGVLSESLYLGQEAQKSLSPAGRKEICVLFPEVGLPSFVPKPCRPIIQSKLAKKLAHRHSSNNKPLFDQQLACA